eukprot:753358-Hanusia_phi.AAC.2
MAEGRKKEVVEAGTAERKNRRRIGTGRYWRIATKSRAKEQGEQENGMSSLDKQSRRQERDLAGTS